MDTPSKANGSFSEAVGLFVERHISVGKILVQMREECGDDPPGISSPQDLLHVLNGKLMVANGPRLRKAARHARSFAPPIDVAGKAYRSAFDAVLDIAERVLLAQYNDDLAPIVVLPADMKPERGEPKWNEVRESIVKQAGVDRILDHLRFVAVRIDEASAHKGPEPLPTEAESGLWWDRLARLGRGRPNVGGKAMWRRLSAKSHEKGKTTFSYDESFCCPKPPQGWCGAHHNARKKLKETLVDGKPILEIKCPGQHVMNWRLPTWLLAQLDRDFPL